MSQEISLGKKPVRGNSFFAGLCQPPGRIIHPLASHHSAVIITLFSSQGTLPENPGPSDLDALGMYFELRSSHIPQGGEVCLPGGGIHLDETSEQAVLREWEEETGIPRNYLDLIGCFGTLVHPAGRIIDIWLAKGPSPSENLGKPNREVEELFTLTLKELRTARWEHHELTQLLRDDISANPIPYNRYDLNKYPRGIWSQKGFRVWFVEGLPHLLWGMTAGIVRSFLYKLYGADYFDESW